MQLSDQFIDLRRKAEEPVQIILVRLLLTLRANLFNATGEFIIAPSRPSIDCFEEESRMSNNYVRISLSTMNRPYRQA